MSADDRGPRADPTALRIELAPRTILLLLVAIAGIWLAFQLETVLIVVTIAAEAEADRSETLGALGEPEGPPVERDTAPAIAEDGRE